MDEEKKYMLDLVQGIADRTIYRLWIVIVLLVVLLAASNMAWLWYINQYDFVSYSEAYTQDGRGVNIIGDGNGVEYGAELQEDAQDADA